MRAKSFQQKTMEAESFHQATVKKNKKKTEQPHYFVENSFQQLFSPNKSTSNKIFHDRSLVTQVVNTRQIGQRDKKQGQSIKRLARKTQGWNTKPATQKIVQGRSDKGEGDVKHPKSRKRTNHLKWVNYLV